MRSIALLRTRGRASPAWGRTALCIAALSAALAACGSAFAAPLATDEIASLCGGADGLAHCGRLVEGVQQKRYPGLFTRDGNVLDVTLYPGGRTTFVDRVDGAAERSFSVWDYQDPANLVVIYATRGDDAVFLLLQRTTGRVFEVPAEPRLSPDYQRVVTADICSTHCGNEIALWRITRDGLRKEAAWSPPERWSDASARWKSADTVEIEYVTDPGTPARTLERRIDQKDWKLAR